MKQSLSLTLSLLFGLALIAVLAKYIGLDKVISVFRINKVYLILFLITSFTIMFLRVLKWKFILESHQIKVPFGNLFMYRIAGFAVSYLTPSAHIGGEPVRAYLLSKHNVDITKAFSSVVIDKAIELTLNGAFTVAFFALILLKFHFNIFLKYFLLLNLILIFFLIVLFYVRTINGKGFFMFFYHLLRLYKIKRIRKFRERIQKIDENNTTLFYQSRYYFPLAFTTHLLAWLLSILEYQLILLMFGFKVSLINAFMVYAGTGFAYLIPLPGALGILEAVQSLIAQFTGLPTQLSFGVSFIVRARDGFWTLLGVVYLYFLKINLISQVLSGKFKLSKKAKEGNFDEE